ncbi:methyl-accepting chemotaxis protein [Shumkonia mesophila]|uniref:methyl-accepting chemotaxis protein n=1 Tax=Shumkonia mesophila TaxID=2838854 RepID=UPI002934F37F|nr:methyl-accepting chemotaxis protein [Shumkonia mesophila]
MAESISKGAKRSGLKAVSRLRIGPRTFLGFALVLGLTTVVSIVGWQSLGIFADRVETSEGMGRLVTQLLQTRVAEKNFQIRGDEKHVAEVNAGIDSINGEGTRIKDGLRTGSDRDTMDRILKAVDEYRQAFAVYADLERRKSKAVAETIARFEDVQQRAQQIAKSHKDAAEGIGKRVDEMAGGERDAFKKVDAISKILSVIADMRRDEKDLQLFGSETYQKSVGEQIVQVIPLTEALGREFPDPGNQERVNAALAALKAYQESFADLVAVLKESKNYAFQQTILQYDLQGEVKRVEDILPKLQEILTGRASQYAALLETGKLYRLLAEAHSVEKDFLLSKQPATLVEQVNEKLRQISNYADGIKGRFPSAAGLAEEMDRIVEAVSTYATKFKALAALRYNDKGLTLKKEVAITRMVENAKTFTDAMTELREQQQQHYQGLVDAADAVRASMAAEQKLAENAGSLTERMAAARQTENAFLLSGGADAAATIEEAVSSVVKLAEDMKGQMKDAAEQKLAGEIQELAKTYQAKFQEIVSLTRQQEEADRGMASAADRVNEIAFKAREDQAAAMTSQKRTADTVAISGTLGALVLGILLAFFIGRSVSRPIRELMAAMKLLAAGNLDVALPALERHDEIGEMAGTVQIFKENANEKVRLEAEQEEKDRQAEAEKRAAMLKLADTFEASVGHVVGQVSSAATEMQSSSEAMSATAEETTRQASAVAAASEQASANVETVASAAEELSSSIAEIGRQVTQASQIASAAVSEAEQTNVKVQGLAQAANKIGEVVALITDIAEQTNLLALNATIEAARAGDAGKGFAVVASEVKNLANQTAKATDEIGAQIAGIQSATQEAVSAIDSITKTISQINEVNSGVASAVEEQGAATQEIARNVEQAAAGTQEVSANIGGVSAAANETGTAAGQINKAAGDLSRQSETLRAEVDKFLASVRTA